MKSIIKIAYKNMFSKKGRSMMLILSVVLSAGLIYSVVNLSVFTKDILISGFEKEYGNSNVLLYKDDFSFIDEDITIDSEYDYIYETHNLVGYTELDSKYVVNMQSFNLNEFNEVYNFEFIDKLDVEFDSSYILIGESNSIEFDLSINDIVNLSFDGEDYNLVVYGIVKDGTTFLDASSNTLDIVINKDFILNTLKISYPNMLLISSDDKGLVEELEESYSEYVITDIFNQEEMASSRQTITVLLFMMAASIVLVSSFVIYSTYKIIVIERLPLLGTLRSIGATKKFCNRILLLESSMYGLLGGILGIGLGVVFLSGMFNLFFQDTDFSSVKANYFNLTYAMITVAFSVFLSVFSSILPIIKTSKYSIKEIMFEEIKNNSKTNYKKAIMGLLLIVVAFIMVESSNYENELMISGIAMLIGIIGAIMSISILILLISPIVQKILQPIFRNKIEISIKNIKNDKTLINNIVLLAVGLGIIFMVNNFSTTVNDALGGVYNQARFDITVSETHIDGDLIDEILLLDGVDNVYKSKSIWNVETVAGFELMYVSGVDLAGYNDYAWGEFEGLITPELLEEFNNKDSIIITNFTSDKYNLEIGDKIEIVVNGEIHELEVIKTISSVLDNGNNSFINIDLFTEIFEVDDYQYIYINVNGNIDEIKNEIKELYIYGVLTIETLDDMEQMSQDNNDMVFSLLRGMSFLAMLIGAIGIINNFMVSFISRRKLIASLRSLGLSKRGTVSLFLVESLTSGIIGSTIGVLFGILFFKYMVYVISAVNITPETSSLSIKEMIFVFVSGIILSVIAALIPALHMSKQNIVKEIKYE